MPPPTDVVISQLTPHSVEVSWSPPRGNRPLSYNICFIPTHPSGQKQLNVVPGTLNILTLTGLDRGTSYVVVVVADSESASCPSDAVIFTLGVYNYIESSLHIPA